MLTFKRLWFVVAGALTTAAMTVPASADGESVTFETPSIPPTPFQLRRAKAKGIALGPKPGIKLKATLFRPKAVGPRPAVVVLISGNGTSRSHLAWGKALANWGYVSLVVHSYASRGGAMYSDTPAFNMKIDAYASHTYLSKRADVDPARIGVLGFSIGGSYVFSILDRADEQRPKHIQFRAAVSFYPNCTTGRKFGAPILVLAGDKDELMSLNQCRVIAKESAKERQRVVLQVFPGATHFFDDPNYARPRSGDTPVKNKPFAFDKSHYNKTAHLKALTLTREFLERHLK